MPKELFDKPCQSAALGFYNASQMTAFRIQFVLALVTALVFHAAAGSAQERAPASQHPLKPPDTSSPRATLGSFITDLEMAYSIAEDPELQGTTHHLRRAVRTLDLSDIASQLRASSGVEAALMLKEVLDRLELPALEDVPLTTGDGPASWTIPETPIKIIRVQEGVRTGEYLFSAETVRRAREFYERIKHLPYREGATRDLYEIYISTPGPGLESRWSDIFPDWSKEIVGEQTVWQWIALGATVLLLLVALSPAILLARRRSASATTDATGRPPRRLGLSLAVVFGLFAIVAAQEFLDKGVNITGTALVVVSFIFAGLKYIGLGWLATLLITQFAELVIRLRGLDDSAAGARLIRLSGWVISGLLIVGVVVSAGHDFGFPVYSIVTGLGVGGIALGFGAQSLVRDILSGVFFLIDDAFRVGEYIQVGDLRGNVEKISIRSMQVRHHNGPLHTIPFGEITQLTNFSRDWVIMKLPLRVTFETDPEKVRKLIKKLGIELLEDPEIGEKFVEPLKSQGVLEIDDIGQIIRVKFMTHPGEQFVLRKHVYARIRELFEREGIEFARREVRVSVSAPGPLTEEQVEEVAAAAAEGAETPAPKRDFSAR